MSALREAVTTLRDELGSDPMAHQHGPTGEGEPDCLGCVVAARLNDALREDDLDAPGTPDRQDGGRA